MTSVWLRPIAKPVGAVKTMFDCGVMARVMTPVWVEPALAL